MLYPEGTEIYEVEKPKKNPYASRTKNRPLYMFIFLIFIFGIIMASLSLIYMTDKSTAPNQPSNESKYQTDSGYIELQNQKGADGPVKFFYTYTQKKATKSAQLAQKKTTDAQNLIIWTNGGPGCSSLSGFFTGIGPLRMVNKKQTPVELVDEEYTVAENADLLTIDQPVGTGFSLGNLTAGQTKSGKSGTTYNAKLYNDYSEVSETLKNIITEFLAQKTKTQYKQIIFVSESMSGHFVPLAAKLLLDDLKATTKIKIVLVSPWVNPPIQYSFFTEFALQNNLITKEHAEKVVKPLETACLDTLHKPDFTTKDIERDCYAYTNAITDKKFNYYDYNCKSDAQGKALVFNSSSLTASLKLNSFTEKYLGFDQTSIDSPNKFTRCSSIVRSTLLAQSSQDKSGYVKATLEAGIPVVVLSGEYDMISSYLGAQKWTSELNTTAVDVSEGIERNGVVIDDGLGVGAGEGKYSHFRSFFVPKAGHMISIKNAKALKGYVDQMIQGDFDPKPKK